MINGLIGNKAEIIEVYKIIIADLTDTKALDKQSAKLDAELEAVATQIRALVNENSTVPLDQDAFTKKREVLVEKYNSITEKQEALNDKYAENSDRQKQLNAMIATLEAMDGLVTEFDEELWFATVETVMAHKDGKLTFRFRSGQEIDWTE